MNNAQFIADYRSRSYRAGGLAASAAGPLLTCPCCGIRNFSERGLSAHCCKAKPGRERLSAAELASARAAAAATTTANNTK
jgi:hypothetical protein